MLQNERVACSQCFGSFQIVNLKGGSLSRICLRALILTLLASVGFSPCPARAQLAGNFPAGNAETKSGSDSNQPISFSQGHDPFSGSLPEKLVPGILQISLQDAINRGLKQNLGLLLSSQDIRSARGSRWQQLSTLLPNLTTSTFMDYSQVDLVEFGLNIKSPSISLPAIVGPFTYFDARAYLTQPILDLKAINNVRSASQNMKSAEYSYKDARDLVVQAIGFAYMRAIADEALIEAVSAQVKTAQTLFEQASDQVRSGTSPAIDALRARVQLQTEQQRLLHVKNNSAIQKLTLARTIGLAPEQGFELTDKSPYQPVDALPVDELVKRAYTSRSDFQSALSEVRAAEYSRSAAVAGYYPTISLSGDFGIAGDYPTTLAHGVFDARGTLNFPIFQGGRVRGDILQAEAQLARSRARLDDLRVQIDSDVRTALLNLQSSAAQVEVAISNTDLAEQTLSQSRDRFAAGLTGSVEIVQSQEEVANAHTSYISSLFAYNYAKISLARAIGQSDGVVKDLFKGK